MTKPNPHPTTRSKYHNFKVLWIWGCQNFETQFQSDKHHKVTQLQLYAVCNWFWKKIISIGGPYPILKDLPGFSMTRRPSTLLGICLEICFKIVNQIATEIYDSPQSSLLLKTFLNQNHPFRSAPSVWKIAKQLSKQFLPLDDDEY